MSNDDIKQAMLALYDAVEALKNDVQNQGLTGSIGLSTGAITRVSEALGRFQGIITTANQKGE